MQPATSSFTHLACPECNQQFDADSVQTFCRQCQSPILAQYDLATLRNIFDPHEIKKRPRGLWRWAELLPVRESCHQITLGEGDTPLLDAPHLAKGLGLKYLFIKDESTNPTATFKARGIAVAVSRAVELGIHSFVIPTAGNAGGALAAYSARANCTTDVFMPNDSPLVNQREVQAFGGKLHLIQGLINAAARAAEGYSKHESDSATYSNDCEWFNMATFKEPYRVEGKKTMGFELAEAFHWELPDVIIYPTGGGTGLVGIWKAFTELKAIGIISAIPTRLVCVQAAGCAPVVHAFQKGNPRTETWQDAHTIASGLCVPSVFADRLILRALKESQGVAISVQDEEIVAAQKQLAQTEGIFTSPEGAATLAATKRLVANGWLQPNQKVVLLNTGGGLKYI